MNTTITSKQKWTLAAVIIVVAIIVLVVMVTGKKSVEAPVDNQPVPVQPQSTVTKKPSTVTPSPVATPAPSQGLSRTAALAKYQDHIVRISDSCVAATEPQSFVVPAGTVFMIDSDGTKTHTVAIQNRTLTLKPQTYSLEKLDVQAWVSSTCDPKTGITTVMIRTNS